MLDLLRVRLAQGKRTMDFPSDDIAFPERFRGRPLVRDDGMGRATIDLGACLFSPEEGDVSATGVSLTHDYRLSSRTPAGLLSSGEAEPVAALHEQMRAVLGRSLRLRSVAAGSCNGCESGLLAGVNVLF